MQYIESISKRKVYLVKVNPYQSISSQMYQKPIGKEVSKSGEFQVTIIHANCEDEATKLMEDFKASFPEATGWSVKAEVLRLEG